MRPITSNALAFNPTGEFIFPSVFHAGRHLAQPLAEWYLYYSPHETPGGIAMMHADSLDGPWTEYPGNPLITARWDGHYDVSHVSSPDAFWNAQAEELFLFFHGENSTTRYATSRDGIRFTYGGVAVERSGGTPEVTESSYARVFQNPDPAEYSIVMLFMGNTRGDARSIRVADSSDGRVWAVRPHALIEPGGPEGANVSSANLWMRNGSPVVVYHGSDGSIWQRGADVGLTEVGPPSILFRDRGRPRMRFASPEIIEHDGTTYLFFEHGDRLHAQIASVVLPL